MTVTYGDQSFLRQLLRWRGSVWKAIFMQYGIFISFYILINLTYRLVLPENEKRAFERFVQTFEKWTSTIPLTFLLGFYVSNVVNRWWQQLNQVSWPDKFLVFIVGNMNDDDEETRLIRRTFARYSNLLATLVWKEISLKIKKRFPTDYHLVKAGLMSDEEYELFQKATSTHGRWFLPVSWIVSLLAKCKAEGRITDYAMQKLLEELYAYRSTAAMLTIYDWISIPLVYTQVITVATYGYFTFCLFARQSLINDQDYNDPKAVIMNKDFDIYFPIFTSLEFIFYIGWLKVGEELRCPFGEGDEDFDMNYVLDRNIHVGGMLVDELQRHRPTPVKDRYWDIKYPVLPHTKVSYKVRDRIPHWRLSKIRFKEQEMGSFSEEELDVKQEAMKRSKSLGDNQTQESELNAPATCNTEEVPLTTFA